MTLTKKSTPRVNNDNSGYPFLLLVPYAVVIALNLIGLVSPTVRTWGFNIWSSFDRANFGVVVGLCIICSIPQVARAVSQTALTCVVWIGRLSLIWRAVAVTIVSAAIGTLFVIFRSDAPIYGDGYSVVANSVLPLGTPPVNYHEWIKVVPVMMYRLAGALLTKQMHLDARLAFGIVSSLGGVVGFWGLWRLARSLAIDDRHFLALMSAGLAGGCTVFFFGHLELYTWGIAALLWLLASAVDFVGGRSRALNVWAWLLIAAATQILLLPTLLLVALVISLPRSSPDRAGGTLVFGLSPTAMSWSLVLCSVVAGLVFSVVPTGFSFVPVWAKPGNPYSAISLAHLVDLLNLIFLCAPPVLTILALALIRRNRERGSRLELPERFLGICVLALFLVSFWLDPGLGAVRDWDLLSFFGFPASIFGAALLLNRFTDKTSHSLVTALSLCLVLVVPAPHISERTNGERALARLDPMVWRDAHYQTSYDSARKVVPWAGLVQTFTKRPDLADKYLWRKISVDPTSDVCWFNLGEIELGRGHLDSAVAFLATAYHIDSSKDVYIARYAEVLEAKGDRNKLRALLPQLASLQSSNTKALGFAGIVLAQEGKLSDALPLFRKAYQLEPWEYHASYNLALTFYELDRLDSAIIYFEKALPVLPKSDRPNVFYALVSGQIKLGRLDDARASLREFQRQFPDDPAFKEAQSLFNQNRSAGRK